ncbi:cupin domain-containing protein [Thiorhodococcus mannitoliphagus]|uniref:Cupin domain-containing protein n=1 Tax=Thiorhodococcus mannitoliphagus TaxID=329406 RepID=A0A6P1DMD5_9GAMM|nr:cupin domain-containing protein [Thiorhodococcus mannitoliphagus]NEX19417.1 cupin domain-containing protein [Thiorhodococcus mannitoliphagus]
MVEGCFILESWNSPDDPAVSVARARVEPGVTTRLHRLEGIVERYLILSGKGIVEVAGLQSKAVGVGDVVYIPAGCGQRIRNHGEVDLVFLAICSPRFQASAYQDIDTAPLT